MKLSTKTFIGSLMATLFLVGCAGNQIVENKPVTEKLSGFKTIVIESKATDKKADPLVADLTSALQKRLVKSKLYDSVNTASNSPQDLIVKADIFEAKIPENKFGSFIGATDVELAVRYTILTKKDNKVIGEIQAKSSSAGGMSIGGIKTDSANGLAIGRNADHLVSYLKKHH